MTTDYTPTLVTSPGGAQTTVYSTSQSGTPPVITPASVSGPVTPPAVVPPATPNTGSAGLGGFVDSSLASLSTAADTASANAGKSLQDLLTEVTNAGGKAENTQNAYAANGVDTDQSSLNDVTNQIAAEKQDLSNRLVSLDKNSTGSFGGNLDQEKQRLTDDSLQRQANLAVIQTAAQGKYDIAKQIADRAVAASTEAEQNKINALQLVYTANKDMFTTAEQEKFTADQAQRTSDLEDKRTQQTAINDMALTALKNGAPASVAQKIQGATSLQDAEGFAGSYLVTPTKDTAADNTAALGTALSDAASAITNGAPADAVRAAFLKAHPANSADFTSYFTDPSTGTFAYPKPTVAAGPSTFDKVKNFFGL